MSAKIQSDTHVRSTRASDSTVDALARSTAGFQPSCRAACRPCAKDGDELSGNQGCHRLHRRIRFIWPGSTSMPTPMHRSTGAA